MDRMLAAVGLVKHSWSIWSPERVNDWPKVSQQVSRTGSCPQVS